MLKNTVLSLLLLALFAFLCWAAYSWLLKGVPEPSTPELKASSQDPAPKTMPVDSQASPSTAAGFRRLARQALTARRAGFEECMKAHAASFQLELNDPIVFDLHFRPSPTGSGRALVRLDRLHSIPEVLDRWLKTGRHKGQDPPDWDPRPDLVPPDCLGPLLAQLDLPSPPTNTVSLSWALTSLQNLGASPSAVPSP